MPGGTALNMFCWESIYLRSTILSTAVGNLLPISWQNMQILPAIKVVPPGMPKKKSVYRPILQKAWQTAIHNKSLWIFGIFAGLANTGSVFDVLFALLKQATDQNAVVNLFQASIPGLDTWMRYMNELSIVSTERYIGTILAWTLLTVILLFIIVAAQTSLIKELKKLKKNRQPKLKSILTYSPKQLIQVFSLDVLARLSMTAILLITSGLFLAVSSETLLVNAIGNLAVTLLFTPVALFIGYMSVFSLIEVLVKNKGIGDAVFDAWDVLRGHLLVVTEVAIILFLITFAITVGYIIVLLLFAVPYLLMFVVALFFKSTALWILTMAIGVLGATVISFSFAGFQTTFIYATWFELYKKMGGRARLRSKLHRFVKHLSRKK